MIESSCCDKEDIIVDQYYQAPVHTGQPVRRCGPSNFSKSVPCKKQASYMRQRVDQGQLREQRNLWNGQQCKKPKYSDYDWTTNMKDRNQQRDVPQITGNI